MTNSCNGRWNLVPRSPNFAEDKSLSFLTISASKSHTSFPAIRLTEEESFFRRSYAQVAGCVLPPVIRYPCELKLGNLKDRKSEVCSVRFQAGELPLVKTKARWAEVSTNSYIRASALGSDYKPPLHDELRKLLLATNRELTAQGNNLNQIAKYLHMGRVSTVQAAQLVDAIREPLIDTLRAVRNALVQEPSVS